MWQGEFVASLKAAGEYETFVKHREQVGKAPLPDKAAQPSLSLQARKAPLPDKAAHPYPVPAGGKGSPPI